MTNLLIEIIPDLHDNLPKIDTAVERLNSLNVALILHAGDYCSPFAALRFQGLRMKMVGVLGINDAERDLLKVRFESLGHEVSGGFSTVEFGHRIGLLHGDELGLLSEIIRSQSYDLVISGYTHSVTQSRTGKQFRSIPVRCAATSVEERQSQPSRRPRVE